MSERVAVKITDTFDIGRNASRSMHLQIDNIVESLDKIGESKKDDIDKLKAENPNVNAHFKGQNTGIYSYETRDKVRGNGYRFADYCRANFGGAAKTLEKISPEMIKSFLGDLAKLNYAENTFNTYCTAIEKIGSAVDVGDSWHKAITEFKESPACQGIVKKDIDHRAYDGQADKVISAITNEKAQVAALVIQETGIRRNEACHFSLDGNTLTATGKNGKPVEKFISDELKQKIESSSGFADGRFDMSKHTLSHVWTRACRSVGVVSSGVHGMRHDRGQHVMRESLESGSTVPQALKAASEDLGHYRGRITWTYQR